MKNFDFYFSMDLYNLKSLEHNFTVRVMSVHDRGVQRETALGAKFQFGTSLPPSQLFLETSQKGRL